MSTAPVFDNQQLEKQNFELRKLNRILRRQVEVLERQNKLYERIHAMDSETLKELSGKPRKRRQREVN
jgi:hypothetical protein